MRMEDAKRVVEQELLKLDMGCVFRMNESSDYIYFENEEVGLNVSIQDRKIEEDEVNIYVEFEKDDVDYQLASHGATYDTISKMFAEYKKIKEME